MNQHDDTSSTLTGDQRIRRLRALLVVVIDRYGDDGPTVARVRRNLADAEASQTDRIDALKRGMPR